MPLSFVKSRRGLAFVMLGFVLEALCVLGRAPGAIELRTPITEAAFVLERPKSRTGLGSEALRNRSL
jgi:hypothetical protein